MKDVAAETGEAVSAARGSVAEVFAAFLRLGCTSFGGPVAHLGYFRTEFVERRCWLDDAAYADLVALCQFLPGPASSQTGFALGLMRAGWAGGLAAFAGFTLPSVVVLVAFAWGAAALTGPVAAGAIAGLKIVAVAIVAQAVWGMARSLAPDGPRAGIAVAAVALLAVVPGAVGQVAAIGMGAALGLALLRTGGGTAGGGAARFPVSRGVALGALILFLGLLVLLPVVAPGTLADAVYRAGALVFGGGHVVLPLLADGVVAPGLVTEAQFLAGYGAAQAVPGPLFTFASYLGAVAGGVTGALVATVAVFLPGFLILVAALPHWDAVRRAPAAQGAMRGANAAVVGILGAALYDPVFTAGVTGMPSFALALACFVALVVFRQSPLLVVAIAAAGGAGLELLAIPG
ncbi:MAG: chromate efflux transporter [Rhodobacteraceae bacterium]|jgi:chromate transporter|nr:chromate efflux transporter [Paracoccaceae bacterium]